MRTLAEIKGRSVITEDGHWLWRGSLRRDGRPNIYAPDYTHANGALRTQCGMRAVWHCVNQKAVPEGCRVFGNCDEPTCCNPAHIKCTSVDDGKLKRLLRGIYELVEVFPPARTISKTVLSNGAVVYDIGDDVLTLSPQEARVLAELSMGAAGTAVLIQSTNQHLFLATELAAQVEKQGREIKALKAALKLDDDDRQGSLIA